MPSRAELAERFLTGRLPVHSYLKSHSHAAAPSLNRHSLLATPSLNNGELHNIDRLQDFFQPAPYNVTLPVPLPLPPSRVHRPILNGLDPASTLVRKKLEWEMKKDNLLAANKHYRHKSSFMLKKLRTTQADSVVIPQSVHLLAEHVACDPDQHFTGSYNWYYGGGGSVEVCAWDGSPCLLRPSPTVQGHILATLLEQRGGVWQPLTKGITILDAATTDRPVYQIAAAQNIVYARQRDACCVFDLSKGEDEGGVGLTAQRTVRSRQPFVSLAASGKRNGEFVTFTTDRRIEIWRPDHISGTTADGHLLVPKAHLSDGWGCLQYSTPNTLIVTDRCCLNLVDIRCSVSRAVQTWCPKPLCELCEELSAALCTTAEGNTSLCYGATTHQLLALDLRAGFTQRWTHLMQDPPYLAAARMHPATQCECVLLGNSREVVAVANDWSHGSPPLSRSPPFLLPSPIDSLHAARLHGRCLQPSTKTRFSLSSTGLAWLTDGGMTTDDAVLRCNSASDVFVQRFRWSREGSGGSACLDEEGLHALSAWKARADDTVLPVTGSCLMRRAYRVAVSDNLRWRQWGQVSRAETLEGGTRQPWQVAGAKLARKTDFLAPRLLAAWGHVDWQGRGDTTSEEEEEDIERSPKPVDRVHDWINTSVLASATPNLEPFEADSNEEMPAAAVATSPLHQEEVSRLNNLRGKVIQTPAKKQMGTSSAKKEFVSGF